METPNIDTVLDILGLDECKDELKANKATLVVTLLNANHIKKLLNHKYKGLYEKDLEDMKHTHIYLLGLVLSDYIVDGNIGDLELFYKNRLGT